MTNRIEDYALIGDRRSAALVSRGGSIDWLCWPRFDSDACFAALLGDERHGFWRLAPSDRDYRSIRQYRADTMILETCFESAGGSVRVSDLMPIQATHGTIIRQVTGEHGEVAMTFDLRLRFDYGSVTPWLRATPRVVTAVAGPDLVTLHSDLDLVCEAERVTACFRVRAGETVSFDLQYGLSYDGEPAPIDRRACIDRTERYWREWLQRFTKPTAWPDAVTRSLLLLQTLIYEPSGASIAAPTLGLPEIPSGSANWDYRYTWLRDSTFALSAFLNAGFKEEAMAWRDWLLRAVAGDPARIRTMYRCDGARHIETREIPWLPGYGGARPVNVGNLASSQLQLDIFGEVLDSIHLAEKAGIAENQPRNVRVEEDILDHVERIWREPDHGIWESRAPPQQFTYSKVMAWVAADRFVKLSADGRAVDDSRRNRIARLRDTIHVAICRDGFRQSRNSFVKAFGSDELDASLLLLPVVGFLPISDPRMTGTITAIERDLVEDGLVRRYRQREDGAKEGAFIACTCWLADCLAMQGRVADARVYFERVLALRNDVGLLAEEWDTSARRLAGNFPQALSHLALINTALRLGGHVLQHGR